MIRIIVVYLQDHALQAGRAWLSSPYPVLTIGTSFPLQPRKWGKWDPGSEFSFPLQWREGDLPPRRDHGRILKLLPGVGTTVQRFEAEKPKRNEENTFYGCNQSISNSRS